MKKAFVDDIFQLEETSFLRHTYYKKGYLSEPIMLNEWDDYLDSKKIIHDMSIAYKENCAEYLKTGKCIDLIMTSIYCSLYSNQTRYFILTQKTLQAMLESDRNITVKIDFSENWWYTEIRSFIKHKTYFKKILDGKTGVNLTVFDLGRKSIFYNPDSKRNYSREKKQILEIAYYKHKRRDIR
jgi:hypothetical protein